MSLSLTIFLNTVSTVSIFLILSLGLFVIFGLMGVVNLAHGELIMIGAYSAVITSQLNISPWLSLLIAPVLAGIIGALVEKVLIRHLYGKIMESILATWGLSIILRQVIELIFGKGYHPATMPISSSAFIFGVQYPTYRLFIILFTIVIIAAFILLERKSNVGVIVKAVMEDPMLASASGINVNKVYQNTFIFGSALAGLAGACIAPLVTISPVMGLSYVITSFLTVLVGGLGSIIGVIGGATLLGGSESLISFYLDSIWANIFVILIAVGFMRFRDPKVQ